MMHGNDDDYNQVQIGAHCTVSVGKYLDRLKMSLINAVYKEWESQ